MTKYFQLGGVIPDIVTVGKPIANGFPIAAVITRREIAEAYWKSGSQVRFKNNTSFTLTHAKNKKWIFEAQFPGNWFEFGIIVKIP